MWEHFEHRLSGLGLLFHLSMAGVKPAMFHATYISVSVSLLSSLPLSFSPSLYFFTSLSYIFFMFYGWGGDRGFYRIFHFCPSQLSVCSHRYNCQCSLFVLYGLWEHGSWVSTWWFLTSAQIMSKASGCSRTCKKFSSECDEIFECSEFFIIDLLRCLIILMWLMTLQGMHMTPE